ncbi:MAG: YbhN family protein, partial [Pirellulales bacterium]
MSTDKPETDTTNNSQGTSVPAVPKGPNWGLAGEIIKYSAVVTIVVVCINILRKRLRDISWNDLWEGVLNVPTQQLILAIVVTALNFVILTGYDWIAITYLKKKLPWRKIMVGAVIGYAFSNVLGWMIGGTAARFRLYTRWGFSLIEVITFISVLSVTFWLGMFMLAGVALVSLPVHLPEQYAEHMPLSPEVFGYVFLVCVLAYLAAALLVRKPIKIGQHLFS